MLVMAGQGMTSPILPLYARSFNVSTATVGLTITFFALARLLLNLPAGAFADRWGRRKLLITGPIILALAMVGCGLARGINELLFFRFFAGAGNALYMVAAQLYILDVSSPDRRGRNLSYNSGALLGGLALGPAMGGIVAELTNYRVPFFFVAGFASLAAIYSYFRLAESLGARTEPTSATDTGSDTEAASDVDEAEAPSWSFLKSGSFIAVSIFSAALFSTRAGTRGTLVPLLAVDKFGLSEGELGAIFGATAIMGLVLIGPAGQSADRLGRKRTIVPTGFIAAAGTIAIVLAPTPGWLTASLFLLALGTSVTGPAQSAFIADITTEQQRGRAFGIYRSAGDLGFLAAPPLLGWFADRTSIDSALTINAIILVSAAFVVLFLAREQRPALNAQ